jgi:hypothetical protein
MTQREKQILVGIGIAILCGYALWHTWQTAVNEGHFSLRGSLTFPAGLVFGIALAIFPGYREERLERGEDISGLKGWRLITMRWWIIIVLALLASCVNYYMLTTR